MVDLLALSDLFLITVRHLTPVWGLSGTMAAFIIGSAFASMVVAAFNTERWIPDSEASA